MSHYDDYDFSINASSAIGSHSDGTLICPLAVPTGQTTVNKKKSADSLCNPYTWHGPQIALIFFFLIPLKIHDKAVQSNILWLNLNNISRITILQLSHKQGNFSFHFNAPCSKHKYPCPQTASTVPKYFPCLLQFCTGYRIWHASRVWKRNTSEKRWFTHS